MESDQIFLASEKLGKTLNRLEQALLISVDDTRISIDATIQRFEFTVELMWLLLKKILFSQGLIINFPKEVLRKAYYTHLISEEQIWLAMLDDRNQTSHTYNQDLADEIYERIKKIYYPLLKNTFIQLSLKE